MLVAETPNISKRSTKIKRCLKVDCGSTCDRGQGRPLRETCDPTVRELEPRPTRLELLMLGLS